jgi:hypothetical protein
MINLKKIIICCMLAPLLCAPIMCVRKKSAPELPEKLSEYDYKTASVQLCFTDNNNVEWLILFQGTDKMYDDCAGHKNDDEHHPVITATRALYDQIISPETIGLSRVQLRHFIDIVKSDNTKDVAVCAQRRMRNVTYITQFDQYKDLLFKTFPDAREHAHKIENREKDRIAIVEKNSLIQLLEKQKNKGRFVKISALEQDPKTKKFCARTITLRPFYVKKMRDYLLDKPYTPGLNPKVRFYRR